MSTKGHSIEIRGIPIEIVRKDIKNLHVGVYPPDGRVRVAAPLRLKEDAVRLAIITRLGWIRRQRASFERQDRQSEREMVSGETHYVEGRRYRLNVTELHAPPAVHLRKTRLALQVRPGSSQGQREAVLSRWYRGLLRDRITELLSKWEPAVGVSVRNWGIRKMKTRWGSCNIDAGRIWLNLELAKKPPLCLEYILVHEMAHLRERHHNERFKERMDLLMPQWRTYRDELNRTPLSHESWEY